MKKVFLLFAVAGLFSFAACNKTVETNEETTTEAAADQTEAERLEAEKAAAEQEMMAADTSGAAATEMDHNEGGH